MNNLYGCEISGYLPYGGFQWLKNVVNFHANSVSEKSPIGYILEIDLEYPNEIHYLHYMTPASYFKKNLSNINITLYNC